LAGDDGALGRGRTGERAEPGRGALVDRVRQRPVERRRGPRGEDEYGEGGAEAGEPSSPLHCTSPPVSQQAPAAGRTYRCAKGEGKRRVAGRSPRPGGAAAAGG